MSTESQQGRTVQSLLEEGLSFMRGRDLSRVEYQTLRQNCNGYLDDETAAFQS